MIITSVVFTQLTNSLSQRYQLLKTQHMQSDHQTYVPFISLTSTDLFPNSDVVRLVTHCYKLAKSSQQYTTVGHI